MTMPGVPETPHQWMSGETWGSQNTTRNESATPDMGEANAAVAASYGNRDGHGVLDVANMCYPGEHEVGDR